MEGTETRQGELTIEDGPLGNGFIDADGFMEDVSMDYGAVHADIRAMAQLGATKMENSMEIKGRIFKNSAIWRINEGIVSCRISWRQWFNGFRRHCWSRGTAFR